MSDSAIKIIGALFITELILGGAGLWGDYLGLSVRKILFTLLAGIFILRWFSRDKKNVHMDLLLLLSCICLVFWVVFLPLLHGIPSNYAVRDALPLVGLLIIFISYDFFENKPTTWRNVSSMVFWLSVLIGTIHIVIYTIYLINADLVPEASGLMISILDPSLGGDEGTNVMIGVLPDGSFRIIWISSVFLLLCLYLSVKRLRNRHFVTGLIGMIVAIVAIYSTGARGFILGIFIGALQALFLYVINKTLRPRTDIIIFLGVLFLFLNVIILLPLYSPDFLSMIGAARDESDQFRYEQIDSLYESFMDHPLLGNGFGASTDVIRSWESPFSYELAILALYMKLGLAGIATAFFIVYELTHNIFDSFSIRPSAADITLLYWFVSAFVVASNTNPYLSNFVGLGIILFIYYELMNIGTMERIHYSIP